MKKTLTIIVLLVNLGMNDSIHAKVFLRLEDGLSRYFSNCKIEVQNIFLTDEQVKKAEETSGLKMDSRLLSRKLAICHGGIKSIYLDTHVVRTQKEVLMIVIGETSLERVELLAFYEPDEYIPGKKWYELLKGKKLQEPIALGGNVPHISGATLTSRATVSAVKKIVSLHEALKNVKK